MNISDFINGTKYSLKTAHLVAGYVMKPEVAFLFVAYFVSQDIVSVKRVRAKGETIEQISSEHLAPGDVIIIPRHGCMMHVDAVLVTGRFVTSHQ